MKVIPFSKLPALTVFAACCFAAPSAIYAQAPAGPLTGASPQPAPASAAKPQEKTPEPPPRTTILGAWKLNPEESDDARRRMQDSRGSNRGGYGGGRRSGGGWPGGGGYGGPRSERESDEERQKMRELLTPGHAIRFSMTGAEVDLTDDQNRKRAFMTDGRKLQKSNDANYQEIAAKWDGRRLVTDEKNPGGGKMSRTFEISYDGRQLYETLHMTAGRNNTPLVIRYVYDIARETRQ